MKKHLRVLAAVLVLCFSLLCPAASAASVQTAACKPSTAAVQTISAGKKTEQMVWVPTHGGKKYHSKSTCSNMKDPEKVHYRKQKRKASLLAKSAIKKIKNDLQSPCRKFSGRGFICVYKKLTKEITEKLQNPIANWFQKSYNMVTARAEALLSVKSFSSCFLGYRAQVLLLRLFSFTVVIHVPHRRYPASCAKKLVRSGRAFLHP